MLHTRVRSIFAEIRSVNQSNVAVNQMTPGPYYVRFIQNRDSQHRTHRISRSVAGRLLRGDCAVHNFYYRRLDFRRPGWVYGRFRADCFYAARCDCCCLLYENITQLYTAARATRRQSHGPRELYRRRNGKRIVSRFGKSGARPVLRGPSRPL